MSPSIDAGDRLRVVDVSGEHLRWVDDAAARELLRSGTFRLVRRGGKVRMLQARPGTSTSPAAAAVRLKLEGRGTGLNHTRFSHRHETDENPPRVWALVRSAQVLAYA